MALEYNMGITPSGGVFTAFPASVTLQEFNVGQETISNIHDVPLAEGIVRTGWRLGGVTITIRGRITQSTHIAALDDMQEIRNLLLDNSNYRLIRYRTGSTDQEYWKECFTENFRWMRTRRPPRVLDWQATVVACDPEHYQASPLDQDP